MGIMLEPRIADKVVCSKGIWDYAGIIRPQHAGIETIMYLLLL